MVGVLEGIVGELRERYRGIDGMDKRGLTTLVGSGNGIRENPALRRMFSAAFGMPLCVPVHREEAAYGAALFALVGAGDFKDIAAAQQIIAYEED